MSGLDGWQQSGWRSLRQLRGRVVLVWFFSLGSDACMAMIDDLAALYREHKRDGLEIIGVHAPDYARDADPLRLARVAARRGIIFPLAMDHRRTVFRRWQEGDPTPAWPRTYVIDRAGRIAADHRGADIEPIRRTVQRLLAEHPGL